MSRLVDPTLCPDCRATLDAVGHLHRRAGCGSPARWPRSCGRAMVDADRIVEQLRALCPARPSPAGPAAAPAVGTDHRVAAAVPGDRHRAPRRAHGGCPSASVPVVLLSLGALCLLVAAVVFVAVTWSLLGLTGRTARAARVHGSARAASPSCSPARTCAERAETFWLVVAGHAHRRPARRPVGRPRRSRRAGLARHRRTRRRRAAGAGPRRRRLGARPARRPAVRRRGGRRGRCPRALPRPTAGSPRTPPWRRTIAVPVLAVLFGAAAASSSPWRRTAWAGWRWPPGWSSSLVGWDRALETAGLGDVVVRLPRLAAAGGRCARGRGRAPARRCPRRHARSLPALRCSRWSCWPTRRQTFGTETRDRRRRQRHPARPRAARGLRARAPGPWGPPRSPGSACSGSGLLLARRPLGRRSPGSTPTAPAPSTLGSCAADAGAAAWTSRPARPSRRRDPRPAPAPGPDQAPDRRDQVVAPWPRRSSPSARWCWCSTSSHPCGAPRWPPPSRPPSRPVPPGGSATTPSPAWTGSATTAYLAGRHALHCRRQRPADRHRHVGLLRWPSPSAFVLRERAGSVLSAAVVGGARRPGRRLGTGGLGGPGSGADDDALVIALALYAALVGSARRTGHASRDSSRDPRERRRWRSGRWPPPTPPTSAPAPWL